jgi:hypothetical protein
LRCSSRCHNRDALALIFLNLAGDDCVEDLERLEAAEILRSAAILGSIERDVLSATERRSLKTRWRRLRERTVPVAISRIGVAGAVP